MGSSPGAKESLRGRFKIRLTPVSLIQRHLHTLRCRRDFDETKINRYLLHAEFIIFKLNISKKI